MADQIDIGVLGHGGRRPPRAEVDGLLSQLQKAVDRCRPRDPADEMPSDDIMLTDGDTEVAAIVPAAWARALRKIAKDPGGVLAELESLRWRVAQQAAASCEHCGGTGRRTLPGHSHRSDGE